MQGDGAIRSVPGGSCVLLDTRCAVTHLNLARHRPTNHRRLDRFSPLLAALTVTLLLAACQEPPVSWEPVRFIALGDTGEGNDDQYAVAGVMKDVCAANGCDFALLLGDNIYDTGVTSLDDIQWQDKFELPYAELDFPFYAVLGNHDYGLLLPDEDKADFQVAYTAQSEKWTMPARHYLHTHQNIDFLALDTSAMYFASSLIELYEAQKGWLDEHLSAADPTRWRIAYGHHPYLSNGPHGNAGWYDGLTPEVPNISGIALKELFDEHLCGRVDLYLCGHDHHREWLEETCQGTQFMVSGAGAKLRDFVNDQDVHWGDDTTEGFAWFEVEGNSLTVQWWDMFGEMNYEGGWMK
ncbi:MAG: hypothetical protein CL928_11005 [Deltaproteobacteria bacterium]|nr:hypothetical protein [Deltaproteobacteria bacterium]|tara:strand:- start:378 stop:1433 length:1056 start_codon:yes stop_codon:yes gene_type:complete